jgi:signal transduction histidine kinase
MVGMSQTLKIPMTSALPDPVPVLSPPTGVRRVLLESGYSISAFVVAVPAFVLTITNLSLGIGLIILVGGVLLLTLAAYVARGFARLERARLRTMLGRPAATPTYLCPRPGDSFWRRMLLPLRDPQSWLDVVWCLVSLVTGTLAFAVTVAWWAMALGGLTYWFWQVWIPYDPSENTTLAELIGLGEGRATESVLNFVIGVLALATLPFAVRLVAVINAALASVLLSSRAELQAEVTRVELGRESARRAEADSLRRLERDIHDGPQQRLVRLTMDLGRARRQLEQDPDRVGETLDAALLQARETVEELRSLSRGIAPPLLVDRGLEAAVAELLLRSPVPVESQVDLSEDLPPHVETAVYFVVAEAMTNVAKHSGATGARVQVSCAGDSVLVRVEDDGVGGAHSGKGLGLAGLQQRLAGVDGTLDVDSPPGGPTVLTAQIPTGGA